MAHFPKRISQKFGRKSKHGDDEESESYSGIEGTNFDELRTSSEMEKQSVEKSPRKKNHSNTIIKRIDNLAKTVKATQEIQRQQLQLLQETHFPDRKNEFETRELNFTEALPSEKKQREQTEKFTRDVRRAFQISTSQLMLMVLLAFGYFTVDMIDEYLAPFFWAVLLSILLQKPKEVLLDLCEPMKTIENENSGYINITKIKFSVLVETVFKKYGVAFLGVVFVGKVCCFVVGWGCWIPWFTLALIFLLFALLVVAVVSLSHSSSLEGFFTTVLVVSLIVLIVLFIFTFGFKAFTESGDFVFKIQDLVQEKLDDPRWGELLKEYGITDESISEGIEKGREQLEIWVEEQGYNMTEIEETITTYGVLLTGNDTQSYMDSIPEGLVSENGTDTETYMAYYDVAMGYYETISELVDFEAVGSIASSIGGFLFGTGTGILEFFSSLIASLLNAIDLVLQFIVFVGALFYFMEADETFVESAVRIVPVSRQQQNFLSDTIHQNIIQVFVTSLLLSFSHGFATLMYFSIFSLDFAYSSAFIVGMMTLFPLSSPWLIYAPGLLIAYFESGLYTVLFLAIGLLVLEQALGFVDDKIFEMIPGSSPYLTGIGLAVGVSTYGVQGILIGPMLIVTTKTLYEIFCLNVAQPGSQSPEEKLKVD